MKKNKSVNRTVCVCVCVSSQAGKALKDVWQWVGWGQPGVFCCRKRGGGEVLEEGEKKHARQNIISHAPIPKPPQEPEQAVRPIASSLSWRHQSVWDFTWEFLAAAQEALGPVWRGREALDHPRELLDETAPAVPRMPVRGWGVEEGLGRGPSLLGAGWQGALLLGLCGALAEDLRQTGQFRVKCFKRRCSSFKWSCSLQLTETKLQITRDLSRGELIEHIYFWQTVYVDVPLTWVLDFLLCYIYFINKYKNKTHNIIYHRFLFGELLWQRLANFGCRHLDDQTFCLVSFRPRRAFSGILGGIHVVFLEHNKRLLAHQILCLWINTCEWDLWNFIQSQLFSVTFMDIMRHIIFVLWEMVVVVLRWSTCRLRNFE